MDDPPGSTPSELELDGWRIQPSLNRLTRGEATVRLEPKLMDVLLFLARHAGQVVSKDAIADAVWPQAFLSESVITRAIAGLRRALEDDAQAPRYIETIAKRGYRLLIPAIAVAAQSPFAERPAAAAPSPPPPSPAAPSPPSSPYVVGQWVRGERFYGRESEIAEILDGPRNGVWVLGARAIGKTSLLKQLERVTASDPAGRYFPLFWDLQGSVEPAALGGDFAAALAEAEERLAEIGLRTEELAADDLFASLGQLRRALRARGRTLLLLWDEVEELLHLQARDPSLLRKLRRALQSQEGIRTVMASGPRLWKLAEQRDDTSPFLHGFAPPLYLGPLRDDAARGLVRQSQGRPEAAFGAVAPAATGASAAATALDDARVAEILRRCGNHPSLLQALCARTLELGDLERATESVAADPTVRFLFAVDFDLLSPLEREVVLAVAQREGEGTEEHDAAGVETLASRGLAAPPAEVQSALLHLERLGVLRRAAETHGSGSGRGDRLEIAGPILGRWLRERAARPDPPLQNV